MDVDGATRAALEAHRDYVAEQVLATAFGFGAAPDGAFTAAGKVGSDGAAVSLAIAAKA